MRNNVKSEREAQQSRETGAVALHFAVVRLLSISVILCLLQWFIT